MKTFKNKIQFSISHIDTKIYVFDRSLASSDPHIVKTEKEAFDVIQGYLNKRRTGAQKRHEIWIRTPTMTPKGVRPGVFVGRAPNSSIDTSAVRIALVSYDDIIPTIEPHVYMLKGA